MLLRASILCCFFCRGGAASTADDDHPYDTLPPRNLKTPRVHWGQGEDGYWKESDVAEGAAGKILEILIIGAKLLQKQEWMTEACGPPGAARSYRLCPVECRRRIGLSIGHWLRSAAVTVERRWKMLSRDWVGRPPLHDVEGIVAHHWLAATRKLNRTRGFLARALAEASCETALSAWADLVGWLAARAEMIRWHVTYSLLVRLFWVSSSVALPPIVFHEFCCSTAEVLVQVAGLHGLHRGGGPAPRRLVEVGVETGATSRSLLRLLPEHVQLIGVDPFVYDTSHTMGAVVAGNARLSPDWLATQKPRVEGLYAEATPGRARLVPKGSPEAAQDEVFDTEHGVDMVFIDGDHSREAVAKDIDAWLKLLRRPAPGVSTRVLAGHDFTLQFPGVYTSVINFARQVQKSGLAADFETYNSSCCAPQTGPHSGPVVNIGSNAVWWISVAPRTSAV